MHSACRPSVGYHQGKISLILLPLKLLEKRLTLKILGPITNYAQSTSWSIATVCWHLGLCSENR